MKKNTVKSIVLFSGWMFLGLTATGQSLEEFINTALANNYQIRILKNDEVIAANNNTAGNAGALPTVDLNGGFVTSLNNTRQEFADGSVREGNNARTSNMSLSLLANWTVFQGFSVYARKDRFAYLKEQGQLNSTFYIEQTVADIATAYAQLVFEIRMQRAFEQTMAISRYRLRLEEKRREVGAGTMMQYNQALADYRTDSIAVLERKSRINTLKIEINRILCVDPETTLTPSDTLFYPALIPDKEVLLTQVERQSYALQVSKLNHLAKSRFK